MLELKDVRTSLEVGFDGELPEMYRALKGRDSRSIAAVEEFPYEDEQFQVVLMSGAVVSLQQVKEAHRVLKKSGRLYFTVRTDSSGEKGMTLAQIYQLMRSGLNLIEVERTPWWKFWVVEKTLSICAEKKNWKTLNNTFRPYVVK